MQFHPLKTPHSNTLYCCSKGKLMAVTSHLVIEKTPRLCCQKDLQMGQVEEPATVMNFPQQLLNVPKFLVIIKKSTIIKSLITSAFGPRNSSPSTPPAMTRTCFGRPMLTVTNIEDIQNHTNLEPNLKYNYL